VYVVEVSTEIAATPARVWRALTDPSEVVRWESGVTALLDAPAGYPRPGQHIRWRTAAGPFRILHDEPQEVLTERKLRALLAVGPFRYDETYLLAEVAGGGCRLAAEVKARTAIPLAGVVIDRLYLGPSTRRAFKAALASIKRFCEA
jgi:hypothetical protein